jgi:hypothetical protein
VHVEHLGLFVSLGAKDRVDEGSRAIRKVRSDGVMAIKVDAVCRAVWSQNCVGLRGERLRAAREALDPSYGDGQGGRSLAENSVLK